MEKNLNSTYTTMDSTVSRETAPTYGDAVQEIGSSMKDLIRSEIALLKAEVAKASPEFQKNSAKLASAYSLYGLGLLPFVAFMVIGLGDALDGQYALSSLIVSLVLVGIAIPLRKNAIKKLTAINYFEKSKENFESSLNVIERKFDQIFSATKGERHDIRGH